MKAMTLYRPLTVGKVLSDFDHYLDSFFGESPLAPAMRNLSGLPAVDIHEADDAYRLDAEIPGRDEKAVQVHVDGRTLTIEARQEEAETKDAKRYLIRERRFGSFSRSFQLPDDADLDSISASYRNGILSLDIRKRPDAQKRIIEIARS